MIASYIQEIYFWNRHIYVSNFGIGGKTTSHVQQFQALGF
jgi:hypothetical protein